MRGLDAVEDAAEQALVLLQAGLTKWIGYDNVGRPHSALAGLTPDEAYEANEMAKLAA